MKTFRYLPDTAILQLDSEKCIGCANCTEVCPHRVLKIIEGKLTIIDKNGCMECGACVTNCPVDALYTNPSDGCGCAAWVIESWWAKLRGKKFDGCNC